jgi:hypothetical protein
MNDRVQAEQILAEVFKKPEKKAVIRGRGGIRRPKRSQRSGFQGRGYTGSDGRMKGQWQTSEPKAPDLPKAPDQPETKKIITEFDNVDDWVMSMILVAFMHANPGMKPEEAIKHAQQTARTLALSREHHRWKKQMTRIGRLGLRAEASKIRREMFKLI